MGSRPLTAAFGSVRFSETLGDFQLANPDGSEIVLPHENIEGALAKLHLFQPGMTPKTLQSGFNAPFNNMFMPAEYLTINCCPECYYDSGEWYCPPCEPPPLRVPDHSRLLNTAFSGPMSCSAGYAGWDREIFEQIVDQFGQDFVYDGVLIQETVTVGRNDLRLPTTPQTGQTVTSSGGAFSDEFFFCSSVCGSGGSGQTVAGQVLYYNGVPVLSPNVIVLQCNGIQWNGQ